MGCRLGGPHPGGAASMRHGATPREPPPADVDVTEGAPAGVVATGESPPSTRQVPPAVRRWRHQALIGIAVRGDLSDRLAGTLPRRTRNAPCPRDHCSMTSLP